MKLGLMISAAVIVAFCGLLFLSTRVGLDAPTQRTSPAKLVAVSLPPDPPAMSPPKTTADDAGALYQRAFEHYRKHEAELSQSPPAGAQVDPLLALLQRAGEAQQVEAGFLDRSLPVAMGGEPAFGDALESVTIVALGEADRLARQKRMADAAAIARSVWILGRRAFENNVRLYFRSQGLAMMRGALARLAAWAEPAQLSTDGLDEMSSALASIRAAWEPKLRIVAGADPPIGDLINIARHDQDRTFRVAATLRLGVARFNPGSGASLRAIEDTIGEGQAGDDQLVAAAADWAAALTLDEMKRLR